MNKLFIAVIVIIIAGVALYFLLPIEFFQNRVAVTNNQPVSTTTSQVDNQITKETDKNVNETVIGESVEGRSITAYHYGKGETELMFIGGIHGGYSWNTTLVTYELMDFLKDNPKAIPDNIKVTVIPVLNPDGLNKVVGTAGRFTQADVPSDVTKTIAGRFNAHTVDLNRNFDCDWKSSAVWQNKAVSGGSKVFSEPESQALKNYVETNKPTAVVTYYSAAGGVYASSCHNGISSGTRAIMDAYAKASGYPAYDNFDFYETTGDMVHWLAKNNIPAISILLTNHQDTEWTKNQKGVEALLKYYAK